MAARRRFNPAQRAHERRLAAERRAHDLEIPPVELSDNELMAAQYRMRLYARTPANAARAAALEAERRRRREARS
jgi:hypothetical protein